MTREELDKLKTLVDRMKSMTNAFINEEQAVLDKAIKALDQEPCDDAISRQAIINVFPRWKFVSYEAYLSSVVEIKKLPSVTSAEKVGEWEWNQYDANPKIGNFHCSLCLGVGRSYYEYCPYCGAKMANPTGAEGSEG